LCFQIIQLFAQEQENTSFFFTPEFLIGKTLEANTDFPETSLQKGLFVSFGNHNYSNDKEWVYRLRYPKTGVSLAVIDFGNTEKLGLAYTLMPFMEFGLFQRKTQRWNLNIGIGGSYMNTQYDAVTNPFNQAITTKLNWSFKSFIYYDVFKKSNIDWRLGLGYLHHSNGHTRLPNQGLNSLLFSVSSTINSKPKNDKPLDLTEKRKTYQTYFSVRTGIGQNVLSEVFNDKKEVYTTAVYLGRIINGTFKFGGGFYYRFYQHYYDYIKSDEELVAEQVPHFTNNPFKYSITYGVSGSAELLMDHIGFEFELGMNFYKPFYKIDWQLNQGYSYQDANDETVTVLGELDSYYKLKRTVSGRLGLKYYLFSNSQAPKNNVYLGAHLNANLGQADFTELSLGYVHRFNLKQKK
jgi:hypothetical protein